MAIKHPTLVAAWLAGATLAELAPVFTEHGYDEVPLLAELSAGEMEELATTVGMTRDLTCSNFAGGASRWRKGWF